MYSLIPTGRNISGILRDMTMDNKLAYIPNDENTKLPLLLIKIMKPINHNSLKSFLLM